MQYSISGEIAQSVRLDFAPGESAWVSKGVLMAYSSHMQWSLRVPGGAGGALRRSLSGEGLALTFLETKAEDQYALLAANAPGHLEIWDLERDGAVTTTRGSFVAAWGENVDITVTVARRAGAAVFGGAGLFLQTISGVGKALVHGSGDFYERQMAAKEELLVSTGNLAAFSADVDYDIRGVGGFRRMIFGGEGLFMTNLRGPGRVLLQTLKRNAGAKSTG
ncbi:MAG: AIM24 family protein [Caldilineaceae bacterium]|nr:AIM24 family protein [Caldilineaceae bacterium]